MKNYSTHFFAPFVVVVGGGFLVGFVRYYVLVPIVLEAARHLRCVTCGQ